MKNFIQNLLRYPKFLALITGGVLSVVIAPIIPLLQKPVTAIATISAIVSGFIGVSLVLRAMLGLDVA
jgi:type II secretory pathway component PulF